MVPEQESGLRPVRIRAPMVQWSGRAEEARASGRRWCGERPEMAYSWFKTSLLSRRAGSRRDVTESSLAHVTT